MNIDWKHTDHCPACLDAEDQRAIGYKLHKASGLRAGVYCCKTCGLVYNNPQPHYKHAFFEESSLLNFTTLDPAIVKQGLGNGDDVLDFIFNHAKLKKGSKILDIGFGIGRFGYPLKAAGYEVHGIEPATSLYNYAVQNGFMDSDKARNMSFESAVYDAGSFDFIFLEPLQHLTDPHAAIQKALGWIKPGGFLLLEVKNSRWLYGLIYNFLLRLSFSKKVAYTSPLQDPFIVCEYRPGTFRTYCRKNGLNISVLRSYACNTYIRYKPADRLMRRFMEKFMLGAELAVIIRKN